MKLRLHVDDRYGNSVVELVIGRIPEILRDDGAAADTVALAAPMWAILIAWEVRVRIVTGTRRGLVMIVTVVMATTAFTDRFFSRARSTAHLAVKQGACQQKS